MKFLVGKRGLGGEGCFSLRIPSSFDSRLNSGSALIFPSKKQLKHSELERGVEVENIRHMDKAIEAS